MGIRRQQIFHGELASGVVQMSLGDFRVGEVYAPAYTRSLDRLSSRVALGLGISGIMVDCFATVGTDDTDGVIRTRDCE